MTDMSTRWAAEKLGPNGQAIAQEARANLNQRKLLRSQIEQLMQQKRQAKQVSDEVVESEIGIGDNMRTVREQAMQHVAQSAPAQQWVANFQQLHEVIPPQRKSEPQKQTLSCADVWSCLSDTKHEGTSDLKRAGPSTITCLPNHVAHSARLGRGSGSGPGVQGGWGRGLLIHEELFEIWDCSRWPWHVSKH